MSKPRASDNRMKPLELRRVLGRTGHHVKAGVESAPIGSADREALERMRDAISPKSRA